STIRYPFQTSNRNTSCNDLAFVDCPDDQTTFLSGIGELCYNYVFRVFGGITQSSYSTRSIRVAFQIPFDDCSTFPTCYTNKNDRFYLSAKYESATILICTTKPPSYTANFKEIQCLPCRNTNVSFFFVPYAIVGDDSCSIYYVVLPADQKYNSSDEKNLLKLMQKSFEIKWNIGDEYCHACETSGGICHTYTESELTASVSIVSDFIACICTDGAHKYTGSDGKLLTKKKWWKTPRYIA
ncbi:hypothetical protein KI387_008769, partial [Taxus chinensis]